MYKDKKFRVRDLEQILEDLLFARNYYSRVDKVFLADGNALSLPTDDLKVVLSRINELFPENKRISIYGAPRDILKKPLSELVKLKNLGLGIIYFGIESGSDKVLDLINKGASSQEIIEAGTKVVASGIELSATLISGLGGKDMWEEHAIRSAQVINQINPHYLGLLTLLLQEGTQLHREVQEGRFKLLSPGEVLLETKKLVEGLNLDGCIFRSNHASNYISLGANLPEEKEDLLRQIDKGLSDMALFKKEFHRRL